MRQDKNAMSISPRALRNTISYSNLTTNYVYGIIVGVRELEFIPAHHGYSSNALRTHIEKCSNAVNIAVLISKQLPRGTS